MLKRKCNYDHPPNTMLKKPKLSTIISCIGAKRKVKQKRLLVNEIAHVQQPITGNYESLPTHDNSTKTSEVNLVDSCHGAGISLHSVHDAVSLVAIASTCSDVDTICGADESAITSDRSPSQTIPFYFSSLPYQWFENQARLAEANSARTTRREKAPVVLKGEEMVVVNRSECSGFIEDNVKDLRAAISKTKTKSTRDHLKAICLVGELFLNEGPILATQNAAIVYSEYKDITLPFSSELYEVISKHLNFIQVYISGKAYLVETGALMSLSYYKL